MRTGRQELHFMTSHACTPLEMQGGFWVPWIGHDMLPEESIVTARHQLFPCLCYVHEGSGEFVIDGRAFLVAPGDLVLFDKGQTISQRPLLQQPWDLYWVQFDGPFAAALIREFGWVAERQPMHIGTATRFPQMFDDIFEAQFHQPYGHLMMNGLTLQLLGYLGQLPHGLARTAPTGNAAQVIKIASYLAHHYAEPLSLKGLADYFCLSRSQLIRIFRQTTALTPMEYLERIRINRAIALLSKGKTINDTAVEVGIPEIRTFYRAFKRVKGCPPCQYRKMAFHLREQLADSLSAPE